MILGFACTSLKKKRYQHLNFSRLLCPCAVHPFSKLKNASYCVHNNTGTGTTQNIKRTHTCGVFLCCAKPHCAGHAAGSQCSTVGKQLAIRAPPVPLVPLPVLLVSLGSPVCPPVLLVSLESYSGLVVV